MRRRALLAGAGALVGLAGAKARAAERVHLAPTAPFGCIDRPPSVNRLIGLSWLASLLHGRRFPFANRAETRAFYKPFYHVDVRGADRDSLIGWADGKKAGALQQ